MAARVVLAPWPVNTLALIRDCFSRDRVAGRGEWFFAWRGTGSKEIGPGAVAEWSRSRDAEASGLCVLEVDEDADGTALFVARRF